jgi:acyl-CoA synthetase (AMP-forming)/AMP-acid ligase II
LSSVNWSGDFLRRCLNDTRRIIASGFLRVLVLLRVGGGGESSQLHSDVDAIMTHTPGSMGHPKGVVSTHRNIISALLSWELDAQADILTGRTQSPLLAARSRRRFSAFHCSTFRGCMLSCCRAQRRLVSMYKWDPELATELFERERITSFGGPAV